MESSHQQDCDYLIWRNDKEVLSYIKDGKYFLNILNIILYSIRKNPLK